MNLTDPSALRHAATLIWNSDRALDREAVAQAYCAAADTIDYIHTIYTNRKFTSVDGLYQEYGGD